MRPEYLSGLVLGPGIGRSWVRFPAPRRSFWGNLFVNFGMSWDVSGSALGMFSDRFGRVSRKSSDGVGRSRTIMILESVWEYFSCVGPLEISSLGVSW